MKRLLPIIFLIVSTQGSFAQDPDTLSRVLVSSMGGFSEVGGLSLQYSVGEPVITTAVGNNGKLVVTQGFHQENLYPVSIEEGVFAMLDLQYWPNPASKMLTLRVSADKLVQMNAGIYDLLGRPTGLPTHDMRVQAPAEAVFDLEPLAEGNYFLILKTEEGRILQSIKIQKIN